MEKTLISNNLTSSKLKRYVATLSGSAIDRTAELCPSCPFPRTSDQMNFRGRAMMDDELGRGEGGTMVMWS